MDGAGGARCYHWNFYPHPRKSSCYYVITQWLQSGMKEHTMSIMDNENECELYIWNVKKRGRTMRMTTVALYKDFLHFMHIFMHVIDRWDGVHLPIREDMATLVRDGGRSDIALQKHFTLLYRKMAFIALKSLFISKYPTTFNHRFCIDLWN